MEFHFLPMADALHLALVVVVSWAKRMATGHAVVVSGLLRIYAWTKSAMRLHAWH